MAVGVCVEAKPRALDSTPLARLQASQRACVPLHVRALLVMLQRLMARHLGLARGTWVGQEWGVS